MVPQELGKYTLDQLCGQKFLGLQFLEVLIEFGYPQIGNNITIAIPAVDKDRAGPVLWKFQDGWQPWHATTEIAAQLETDH